MSRARPGRARATTAAPSNLPPAGDNRAVPLRSCSFFVPLAAVRRPQGTLAVAASPVACGSATPRRPRPRWPRWPFWLFWPTSAVPPFLTRSSSSHFRLTAKKRQSGCRKVAGGAMRTFSAICGFFSAKQNNFGRKNRKKIQK